MINQQTLELYIYVDGVNDIPFFSGTYEEYLTSNGEQFITSENKVFNIRALNEDIIIHAFTYNAQRMGGAPTITTTIKYGECLDELFSEKVYAKFNGERYFLLATPSSSYSNSEVVYKHDATFVSERAALENTYCYDVVSEDFANDTIVSNNSEFSFFGDIHEFAQRLNYSLNYSGLDYTVIVDAGIESDEELIIVDNKFFSDVLQEAYNTYDLPYYFVGKEIHIGYSTNAIEDVFRYGDSDALVSISKTNANQRTINRVTGLGSGDNLPYYYPNATPKGNVAAVAGESNVGIKDSDITILDVVKFANEVEVSDEIVYREGRSALPSGYLDNTYQTFTAKDKNVLTNITRRFAWHNGQTWASMEKISGSVVISTQSTIIPTDCQFVDFNNEVLDIKSYLNITSRDINNNMYIDSTSLWDVHDTECTRLVASLFEVDENGKIDYDGFSQSFVSHSERLRIDIPENLSRFGIRIDAYYDIYGWDDTLVTFDVGIEVESTPYWDKNGDHISLQDIALEVSGTPVDGDTIKQTLVGGYMKPQKTLILPIYRETLGAERFYNAANNTYFIPDENGLDSGLKYEFENEYNGHNPKEQIVQFEEIKPTIKGMSNSEGLRIDMFSEFAYDEDDNNETFETEDGTIKYRHPYFFGKLRKLDFNLFDHATEDGEMVIAMTNGHCGGCEFKVAVDADTKKNTVQVDENGNLVYENGYVVCGAEDYQSPVDPQPQQQDTINNEVWIALYKDKDTFGEIMPNTTPNRAIRPQACSTPTENDGDTFVILNINLPHQYIIAAEEELRQQVIQFMWDNNREKFNFAIKFSRIYFAEHPEILALLDENARIIVEYDDVQYTMYVSSLSYKATETEILPEITVELKDELSVSKNAIQRAESRVKADVYRTINGMDIIAQGAQVFLRKDMPDTARQPITFKEKTAFDGEVTLSNQIATNDYFQGEKGLRIGKDANNNWHIEADFLDVRKKFYAKEVEIQKVYHIGGAQIKSAASLVCSKVDDIGDSYRCWFENSDIDGNVIENQFAVGDQAYVRTFNLITDENGNTTNHFYWRLVVGVDANSIVLSKDDCADGSTVPMVGDNIVQLGNRTDLTRQSAVIDAGAGKDAPYYRQYVGINSFYLPEPETQLKPNDNVLTGRVDVQEGSILSGKMAIKGDDDSIVTLLNGSDDLLDGVRKIVIAAGVEQYDGLGHIVASTKILDDGTIILGDKAGITGAHDGDSVVRIWAGASESEKHEAPFRVQQDGKVIATNAQITGDINATSGKIGDYIIGKSAVLGLSATAIESNNQQGRVSILPYYMEFAAKRDILDDESGEIIYTEYGTNVKIGGQLGMAGVTSTQIEVATKDALDSLSPLSHNASIKINCEDSSAAYEGMGDVSAERGNHAIMIDNGDICGLRLHTRRLSNSSTLTLQKDSTTATVQNANLLSKYDTVVIAMETMTLVLPHDAEDGQIYYIKPFNGTTTVKTNPLYDHKIMSQRTNATSKDLSSGAMNIFMFDAVEQKWHHGFLQN